MSARVESRDHGANAMVRRALELAKGSELRVGILAKGGDDAGEGLTVSDVATFNEFGLGVPERSFIRGWYDETQTENKAKLRALQARVMRGEITREQAINQLGLLFQADIQKRMAEGIPPANAPSTIAAKGSSTPLVHTGQLKSSITYEVA